MRSTRIRRRTDRTQVGWRSYNVTVSIILNMQRLWCIGRRMERTVRSNFKLHFHPIKKGCNKKQFCNTYQIKNPPVYDKVKNQSHGRKYKGMAPCKPKNRFECVPQCCQYLHESLRLFLYFRTHSLYQKLKIRESL